MNGDGDAGVPRDNEVLDGVQENLNESYGGTGVDPRFTTQQGEAAGVVVASARCRPARPLCSDAGKIRERGQGDAQEREDQEYTKKRWLLCLAASETLVARRQTCGVPANKFGSLSVQLKEIGSGKER